MKNAPINWFFYGHFQIALAAAGLGWVSLRLCSLPGDFSSVSPILLLLFLCTLGVYTLHRILSFQRAGERPTSQRYNLVAVHPGTSLGIGAVSMIGAAIIGLPFLHAVWPILLGAVPVTVLYLTPLRPGWRRLRDIPYMKSIWVALAWTLMTHVLPLRIIAENNPDIINENTYFPEMIIRFLFTGSIAVLFDFRDVVLDRSQGVRTIAGDNPVAAKLIVTAAMMICCGLTVWMAKNDEVVPLALVIPYLIVLAVSVLTDERREEGWFAVVVNGVLWGPGVVLLLFGN